MSRKFRKIKSSNIKNERGEMLSANEAAQMWNRLHDKQKLLEMVMQPDQDILSPSERLLYEQLTTYISCAVCIPEIKTIKP